MRILIVSATPFEVKPVQDWLEKNWTPKGLFRYVNGPAEVNLLFTGVGMAATAYALGKCLALKHYDLVMNAGIAGAYHNGLKKGDVVQVVSETFADLGAEEADGAFSDIFRLGLLDVDAPPFREGVLINEPAGAYHFLPVARGLTVNKVHGFPISITRIREQYPLADIETMEGAAFFYVCLMEAVPFLAIRSVSNYVEARNRAAWDIPGAIGALNRVLVEILGMLGEECVPSKFI